MQNLVANWKYLNGYTQQTKKQQHILIAVGLNENKTEWFTMLITSYSVSNKTVFCMIKAEIHQNVLPHFPKH